MKSALFSFLLSVLLLLGCNDETPIQPDEPEILEEESYEIIEIPTKPAGIPTYNVTETIDGSKGGFIKIKESS